MAVRKIKSSWWVDLRADYKRYRIRSPENTKAGAEAYEATLRQKLARGEPIGKAVLSSQEGQTFGQFAPNWLERYVQSNNKYSERRAKKYILRSYLVPFFGRTPIAQITTQHIEQYKAQVAKKIANKTTNNHLSVLKKCLDTAYDWLGLAGTPPKITWLKSAPPKTDYLTQDESDLLLESAEGVMYEMLLAALRTGMRQGELKGLQWSSIDWENRHLTVRHSRCDYTKELGSTKSNRERHIPMAPDLYETLHKRRKENGYVFLDADKHPFDEQRLRLRLANVCKKAGLRHIGWHTLRHTFASQLVMSGASLPVVQSLMGHSTITMTMRYTHLAPSTLRSAIDQLASKQAIGRSFGQPVGNQWLEAQQKALRTNSKT
jgi:integrase